MIAPDLRYARSPAPPFHRALLAARGLLPARTLPFEIGCSVRAGKST